MQNKRRQALAERVFKVAGDYKKVSGATLKLGRTAFETEEIRRFRERVNEYSRAFFIGGIRYFRGQGFSHLGGSEGGEISRQDFKRELRSDDLRRGNRGGASRNPRGEYFT